METMCNKTFVCCLVTVFLLIGSRAVADAQDAQVARTALVAERFEELKQHPLELTAFLRTFPKGGDIHTHLVGAVYAETLIDLGVKGGYCIDENAVAFPPPCDPGAGKVPLFEAAKTLEGYSAIVDAWSIRNFERRPVSGFEQFFGALSRIDAVFVAHRAEALAEVLHRAAGQNIQYLEIMVPWGMSHARALGTQLEWDEKDNRALLALLDGAGLADTVATAIKEIDAAEAKVRQLLGCGEPSSPPACDVTLRYQAEVIGAFPPEMMFAQFALAFALVEKDPRVVALNVIVPSVGDVPQTYEEQMNIVRFFKARRPNVNVTVHAGQLTMGLVPPEDLRDQIRLAIEVAGVNRIGHGTDIMYENDPYGLLAHMAERHIAVETNLTSNAIILGVQGQDHPFQTYQRHDVPTLLSTDDEGTLRIDLTHEYVRATKTYDLSYADLKGLARNSLTYAFLAGESLWSDPRSLRVNDACAETQVVEQPKRTCRQFLEENDKAAAQWRLERAFFSFEESYLRP